MGSLKDGKVDAAVSFDGQVLALQSDGLLTSGRIYDMNGTAVMIWLLPKRHGMSPRYPKAYMWLNL